MTVGVSKRLRAAASKYQKSLVSRDILDLLIFCLNDPLGIKRSVRSYNALRLGKISAGVNSSKCTRFDLGNLRETSSSHVLELFV